MISEAALSRSGLGLIGQADALGDFHSHIDFFLEDLTANPLTPGAYAVLATLNTDALGVIDSEPFWIVWGYDITEAQHGAAVEFFAGSAVPEPSGLALFGLVALGLARQRRRKV